MPAIILPDNSLQSSDNFSIRIDDSCRLFNPALLSSVLVPSVTPFVDLFAGVARTPTAVSLGGTALGLGYAWSGTGGYVSLGLADSVLDPVSCTMLIATVRTTSTSVEEAHGYNAGSDRVLVHLPYVDNTCYWDYGNSGATGRVYVNISSYLAAGTVNVWAFVAGSRGREIWRNGLRLASNTGGTATRTTGGGHTFRVGSIGGTAALYDTTSMFVLSKEQMSEAALSQLTSNPSAFFRKKARILYFPSAGGGGATITPTGLSSSAFGSFSVNAGDRILTFTGKASDEAFGVFNLRARNKILLTGKSSNEAFGSFNVYPGKVILLPNSKTSDNAIGSSSLLSGQKLINPVAKTTDNAFGSFIIVSGDRILLINGIASSEAFGAFSVNNNTATQNVLPSGYFDSAFGSFSLRPDQYIIFEGKEYLEFGQFLLSGSAVVRAMHFFDWVSQQPGLRGSMNDKLYQYLRDHGFTGSTPTMLFLWLRSLGYVGNTATMLTAFERDYTTRWH